MRSSPGKTSGFIVKKAFGVMVHVKAAAFIAGPTLMSVASFSLVSPLTTAFAPFRDDGLVLGIR